MMYKVNITYTKDQLPPLFETVIVNGGIAYYSGKEWISCVGDYQVIEWDVKWWTPLIYDDNIFVRGEK